MAMEEEKEPFLDAEAASRAKDTKPSWRTTPSKRFVYIASALNLIILAATVLVSVHRIRFSKQSSTSTCYEHFPNQLSGAVATYERDPQLYTKFQDSPYTGLPNEKNDKAWHDLMDDMVIRVTDEELARSQQTSLPLPNGGYMAWLGVYHELHCIKMLRQFKYKSYYHPNLTVGTDAFAHMSVHADHCLEMLRASAMCHADGSLTTFKWSQNAAKPMLDLTRPSHKCVDWNALTGSLKDRVVREDEMERMVNPDWQS